jgi:hypothetical protein
MPTLQIKIGSRVIKTAFAPGVNGVAISTTINNQPLVDVSLMRISVTGPALFRAKLEDVLGLSAGFETVTLLAWYRLMRSL